MHLTRDRLRAQYPYHSFVMELVPIDVQVKMSDWLNANAPGWESIQDWDNGHFEVYFENIRQQQLFEIAWSEWLMRELPEE